MTIDISIIERIINIKMNLIKHFNNGLNLIQNIYYKNYELGLIFCMKML
jgi:hypothetical protein